tara:strand:+ start:1119 stop:1982 length:864 start_codon:yes stop_codon:yes gene_type:complete
MSSTTATISTISTICLPQVLPETSKEAIRRVFEQDLKLGNIVMIDMVPRTNSGETCSIGNHDKFLVFVHLKWNIMNPDAWRMSSILGGGGQVRIFYMKHRFWWVRKSTSDASKDKIGGPPSVELPPKEVLPDPLSIEPVTEDQIELIEFPIFDDPAPYTSHFIPSTMTTEEVKNSISNALTIMSRIIVKKYHKSGKWDCEYHSILTTHIVVCLWKYKSVFLVETQCMGGDRTPFVRIHREIMSNMGFPNPLTFEQAKEVSKKSTADNSSNILFALRRETMDPDSYVS